MAEADYIAELQHNDTDGTSSVTIHSGSHKKVFVYPSQSAAERLMLALARRKYPNMLRGEYKDIKEAEASDD